MNARALTAEAIGAFTLVGAYCGSALLAPAAIEPLIVAFAIGFSVLAMAQALGHISGGHFNPAVTFGLVASGRFKLADAWGYIAAQIVGGLLAAALFRFALVGTGAPAAARFAAIATTVGDPGRLTLTGAFVVDLVATAILLVVFVGATAKRAPAGFAPIAIGLVLVALHLMTHTLVKSAFNPARAIATAAFAGGKPLADLWVFVAAPLLGGVLGGLIGRWLQDE